MLSHCCAYDDACPVSDYVLGKLYSANECSFRGLLDAIKPEIKPALAFFCYRRAHLQAVGLAIAASCDESELVYFGGEAGTVLFARSREQWSFVQAKPTNPFRRNITLAGGPMRPLPFDNEDDDRSAPAASRTATL
jgi:hypothetical protein